MRLPRGQIGSHFGDSEERWCRSPLVQQINLFSLQRLLLPISLRRTRGLQPLLCFVDGGCAGHRNESRRFIWHVTFAEIWSSNCCAVLEESWRVLGRFVVERSMAVVARLVGGRNLGGGGGKVGWWLRQQATTDARATAARRRRTSLFAGPRRELGARIITPRGHHFQRRFMNLVFIRRRRTSMLVIGRLLSLLFVQTKFRETPPNCARLQRGTARVNGLHGVRHTVVFVATYLARE